MPQRKGSGLLFELTTPSARITVTPRSGRQATLSGFVHDIIKWMLFYLSAAMSGKKIEMSRTEGLCDADDFQVPAKSAQASHSCHVPARCQEKSDHPCQGIWGGQDPPSTGQSCPHHGLSPELSPRDCHQSLSMLERHSFLCSRCT